MYPNKGIFTIDFTSKLTDNIRIEVYTVTGQLIYSQQWNVQAGRNNTELNLSGLDKGIYFAKIVSPGGYKTIRTVIY